MGSLSLLNVLLMAVELPDTETEYYIVLTWSKFINSTEFVDLITYLKLKN